jgi:hypothetical protein
MIKYEKLRILNTNKDSTMNLVNLVIKINLNEFLIIIKLDDLNKHSLVDDKKLIRETVVKCDIVGLAEGLTLEGLSPINDILLEVGDTETMSIGTEPDLAGIYI